MHHPMAPLSLGYPLFSPTLPPCAKSASYLAVNSSNVSSPSALFLATLCENVRLTLLATGLVRCAGARIAIRLTLDVARTKDMFGVNERREAAGARVRSGCRQGGRQCERGVVWVADAVGGLLLLKVERWVSLLTHCAKDPLGPTQLNAVFLYNYFHRLFFMLRNVSTAYVYCCCCCFLLPCCVSQRRQ